jgi:DNA-binding HxlR family transcriptional regulator
VECEKKPRCNIGSIIDIIGSKWNLLIVWHLGGSVVRFTELQHRMCGVNSKTVTKHLRDLERHGVITRKVYAEVPPRVEYALTERGEALLPIIVSMLEWGGAHLPPARESAPETAAAAAPE